MKGTQRLVQFLHAEAAGTLGWAGTIQTKTEVEITYPSFSLD